MLQELTDELNASSALLAFLAALVPCSLQALRTSAMTSWPGWNCSDTSATASRFMRSGGSVHSSGTRRSASKRHMLRRALRSPSLDWNWSRVRHSSCAEQYKVGQTLA